MIQHREDSGGTGPHGTSHAPSLTAPALVASSYRVATQNVGWSPHLAANFSRNFQTVLCFSKKRSYKPPMVDKTIKDSYFSIQKNNAQGQIQSRRGMSPSGGHEHHGPEGEPSPAQGGGQGRRRRTQHYLKMSHTSVQEQNGIRDLCTHIL